MKIGEGMRLGIPDSVLEEMGFETVSLRLRRLEAAVVKPKVDHAEAASVKLQRGHP